MNEKERYHLELLIQECPAMKLEHPTFNTQSREEGQASNLSRLSHWR
jgi:hypothetical protein